ncbi:MAG: exodeoxyribonuclease III [Candidatus Methanomethylophilaceae archaeon]|nr:exodeoxyribonuclease III [Candidatus Methanomethylophilaceae archaeon]
MKKRLISWNVNGIRAATKAGLPDWLRTEVPSILCLQETKAHPEQVPEEMASLPCHQYYSRPGRKGYSGVGLITRDEPVRVTYDFHPSFDDEGRLIQAEYPEFTLLNVYFPNGKASPERLQYKMEFYAAFQEHCAKLRAGGQRLVVCGDVNTAHRELDLARPKENESVSGFLPEERAWMDRFFSDGYLDTFRLFHADGGHYSWWSVRTKARERNVGWRIDYFIVSADLRSHVVGAGIMPEVMGSDHCPVFVDMDL